MVKLGRLKPDDTSELVEDFNAFWDQRAYEEIDRNAPELTRLIGQMVRQGLTPDQIGRLVRTHAPQRWLESQQVKQAARYIQGGGND